MSAQLSVDPGRLAWLPLAFLAEQELQVDADNDITGDSAQYRDVMVTGLWVYQLHCYRMLVRRRFGERVAGQVQTRQQAIFDTEQAGAGAAIAAALHLVDSALDASSTAAAAGRFEFPMAAEHSVALALLIGLPESPDYSPAGGPSDRQVYRQSQIDERLARLLASGQRELLSAFRPLFSAW